jgi:hypothetical protein
MKKVIALVLVLSVFACDDEANPEEVKAFNDITGDWSFTGNIFSGNFKVVKTLDGKFAIDPPNEFTIHGKTYIATNSTIIPMYGLQINIQLYSKGNGSILLDEAWYKSDYTEMTSGSQLYTENCVTNPSCPYITTYTEIKITRK